MTLEFRVQHDVDTDAAPSSSAPARSGVRGLLDRLAARRAAARVRRAEAELLELAVRDQELHAELARRAGARLVEFSRERTVKKALSAVEGALTVPLPV